MHLLPTVWNLIIVLASLEGGRMVIVPWALACRRRPHRGGMLGEDQLYVLTKGWLATVSGLGISVAVFGIHLIADALRDRLDPQQKPIGVR